MPRNHDNQIYSDFAVNEYRQRLFHANHDFLRGWDWEWIAHLTFPDSTSHHQINKSILNWFRQMQKRERIQVASAYFICWIKGHPHIHALMLGHANRNNSNITNLLDVDASRWGKRWPYRARVEPIIDYTAAVKYVALHTFKFKCDEQEAEVYNIKLLQSTCHPV